MQDCRQIFGSQLPPGVRDVDCDGGPMADSIAGENHFWKDCGSISQERLSSRFVELHAEFLRDAILDAEDANDLTLSRGPLREFALGELLWSTWIRFRDRALREMRRGGELFQS
jgi:hypothetical protein